MYFGIGIENYKYDENVGTLWRTAFIFGASFIFTIGKEYKRQRTDTVNCAKQIPMFHFEKIEDFIRFKPLDVVLIGIEMLKEALPISKFVHQKNSIYLLGSESKGLSDKAIKECNHIIQLPGKYSLNVSVAGSIVIFDRMQKLKAIPNFDEEFSPFED